MVLPHEHLLWDQACWGHPEPQELGDREEYRQPVSMGNRGRVIYHAFDYRDNLVPERCATGRGGSPSVPAGRGRHDL